MKVSTRGRKEVEREKIGHCGPPPCEVLRVACAGDDNGIQSVFL